MQIGDLSLFSRTSSRRTWTIAAYHSRHSLTWSWVLSLSFDIYWRKPSGGLRFAFQARRDNHGRQITLAIPFVVIHRHQQKPMWFRDMYWRARDREDSLEGTVGKLRRDVSMARMTALLHADESRPQ